MAAKFKGRAKKYTKLAGVGPDWLLSRAWQHSLKLLGFSFNVTIDGVCMVDEDVCYLGIRVLA